MFKEHRWKWVRSILGLMHDYLGMYLVLERQLLSPYPNLFFYIKQLLSSIPAGIFFHVFILVNLFMQFTVHYFMTTQNIYWKQRLMGKFSERFQLMSSFAWLFETAILLTKLQEPLVLQKPTSHLQLKLIAYIGLSDIIIVIHNLFTFNGPLA